MDNETTPDLGEGQEPSFDPPVEETPPEGFEPQPELSSDQVGELVEREPDLIAEAEDANPDDQSEGDGEADDDNDFDDRDDN